MKRVFKKNLSLSMVSIFILAIIQFNALIVFADTSGDFTIALGVLTKYNGTAEQVVIPDSVTSIGSFAFSKCTKLTSITVPNSVTSVGDGAFAGCNNLITVNMTKSVKTIGSEAFQGTLWLDTYQSNFVIVGNNILIKCKENQTSTTIPDNVTTIGRGSFMNNKTITSLTIPSGVTTIEDRAVMLCPNLANVTIPSSVTSIGADSFVNCTSLTIHGESKSYAETYAKAKSVSFSTIVDSSSTSTNTNGFTITDNVLIKYKGTDSAVTIPEGVTSIGAEAFSASYTLKSITMPNSVTSIGEKAFFYCDKLTSITFPSSISSIGASAFDGCNSLTNVTIPSSVSSLGDSAFADCTRLTSITIPSSVTSIGSKTFFYASSALTITGKSGSYAETYAKTYGIHFKNIDETATSNPSTSSKAYTNVRLAGKSRVGTALEIAKEYSDSTVNNIILATAYNFPDALAGSVLANKLSAPILLVGDATENNEVYTYIEKHLIKDGKIYILGGEGAVSAEIISNLNSIGYNNIIRLSGVDRIDTSVKIENQLSVESGTPVILTTANDFPDALSISSIAAQKGYPILLTNAESLNQSVIDIIQNIKPSEIIIVGGTGIVSSNIENQLKGYSNTVTRLAGKDRYETSMNIINHFKIDATAAVIATGDNFPDALAGSVFAAKNAAPIILVNNNNTDSLQTYLSASKITKLYVLGGVGAIADSIISTMENKK